MAKLPSDSPAAGHSKRGRPQKAPYNVDGSPNLSPGQARSVQVEAALLRKLDQPAIDALKRDPPVWEVPVSKVVAQTSGSERVTSRWRRLRPYRDGVLAAIAAANAAFAEEISAEVNESLARGDAERDQLRKEYLRKHTLRYRLPEDDAGTEK